MLRDEDKAKLKPRFFMTPVQNDARSKAEGRPIFDELEMVEYPIPGERLVRFVAHASEDYAHGVTHIDMFPEEYARFKRGQQNMLSGTPLKEWPIMTVSRVAELNAINVYTVEELANVSDAVLSNLGTDARKLREQAQTYLSVSKGQADSMAMAGKIAELEAKIKALTEGAAPMPEPPAVSDPEPVTVDINDATDAQLKQYIKERTGEAPRGNVSRETLLSRVQALAGEPEQVAA